MDALAEFREPVRLTELARALKMTLPRISRHVSTLRALGFIEKAEPLEAYRLGTKLFVLGQIALEQNALVHVAPPHLSRLRDQVRHSVILSTQSGEGGVVLTCIPSNESPTIVVRPGTNLKMPNSPSARVLSAFSRVTEKDGVPLQDNYPEERHKFIMAHYYDFETDTRGSGIGSIAAPVFDHNDQIALWISVGLPDEKLIRKAVSRAEQVIVYSYGGRQADVWWSKLKLGNYKNLRVINLAGEATQALAAMAARGMKMNFTIQEGEIMIANDATSLNLTPQILQ